jgi:hypothetical protein
VSRSRKVWVKVGFKVGGTATSDKLFLVFFGCLKNAILGQLGK